MFLGQLIDKNGIQPDPGKIAAIKKMSVPSNVAELHKFLGNVNHLSKFAPNLADKTKPLHDLLIKNNQWTWGAIQHKSFEEVKQIVIYIKSSISTFQSQVLYSDSS